MTWDVCRVIFAIRELLCDMPADGPIIAIATSAGDLAVYTVNEMRRLYHMSNITALLMPHELMSCPDFTGHVIISITPAHSPVSPAGSSVSDARPINQPFLLLGLSCGIVVVVETGIFYLVLVSLSAIVVLSVSCISIGITTTVLIIFFAATGSCSGRACNLQKPSPLVSVLVTDDMGYAAWAGSSEAASPIPGCPSLPPQPRPAAPLCPPSASRLIVVCLEHTCMWVVPFLIIIVFTRLSRLSFLSSPYHHLHFPQHTIIDSLSLQLHVT